MPFTSPYMFGTSSISYPAQIKFDPDPGSGTAGGVSIYTSTITVLKDTDNYFSTPISSTDYDVLPFAQFGTFEFSVLENTLSGNSVINSVTLQELIFGDQPFAEQTIFEVWNEAQGALTPTATKTITDTVGPTGNDSLASRIGPVDGDSRILAGYFTVGIKKL